MSRACGYASTNDALRTSATHYADDVVLHGPVPAVFWHLGQGDSLLSRGCGGSSHDRMPTDRSLPAGTAAA